MAWLIIAFGAIVRAADYFSNAALYVDEGSLALNIINRSLGELFGPLDFNQAAPAGFLALEKLAVVLLGDGELALRLFPFLFSIASLILFYRVAKRTLSAWAVPVALLFFAASINLIHYSAQLKQYSSDVASTLLIVLLALQIEVGALTARRVLLFGLTGSALVWLSHPSVFVLAGAGTTLALAAAVKKDWPRLWRLTVCFALWVASFAAVYVVSLGRLSANQTLEASWQDKGTFMPLPPGSLSDLKWFGRAFVGMFSNPLASPLPLAAAVVFIVGCAALFLKNRMRLLLLVSPFLFTLAASGLHKYPFGRRLLLFLLPLMILIIAAGIEFIIESARPYAVLSGLVVLEAALFQLLSGGPVAISFNRLILFAAFSVLLIAATLFLMRTGRSSVYGAAAGL
jgi:hypothetical protein